MLIEIQIIIDLYMYMYVLSVILTRVRTSLAKSLAISGVTKQERPLRANPDSY